MSKFKKLQSMLEKKGYKKDSAGAIAASVGREKYGQKRMSEASKEHKPASKVRGY